MVDVVSRRGRVRARAMVSRQVRRGLVWMPFHFAEAKANYLTNDAGDEVTGTGEYKVCAVRLEPATGEKSTRSFPGNYVAAPAGDAADLPDEDSPRGNEEAAE